MKTCCFLNMGDAYLYKYSFDINEQREKKEEK